MVSFVLRPIRQRDQFLLLGRLLEAEPEETRLECPHGVAKDPVPSGIQIRDEDAARGAVDQVAERAGAADRVAGSPEASRTPVPLGIVVVPAAFVPIRLLITTLLVDPAPFSRTPAR